MQLVSSLFSSLLHGVYLICVALSCYQWYLQVQVWVLFPCLSSAQFLGRSRGTAPPAPRPLPPWCRRPARTGAPRPARPSSLCHSRTLMAVPHTPRTRPRVSSFHGTFLSWNVRTTLVIIIDSSNSRHDNSILIIYMCVYVDVYSLCCAAASSCSTAHTPNSSHWICGPGSGEQ